MFDSFEYSGSFKDGELEGFGTMTYNRGDLKGHVYEGYFHASEIDSGWRRSGWYYYEGTFSHMRPWNGKMYVIDTLTQQVDSTKFTELIDGSYNY